MKKIVIFGSTGSIGKSTLDIIRRHKSMFRVLGLSANQQVKLLEKQIAEFNPKFVYVREKKDALRLRNIFKKIKVFFGEEGLLEFSSFGADIGVMAISGIAALKPLLIALRSFRRIALANKESVVTGYKFIQKEQKKSGCSIIPVDSETNAIFQLFNCAPKKDLKQIYITASGGPFLGKTKKELRGVTPKEALNHPNWIMGQRITIDSATLVNKAFEVAEAKFLFSLQLKQIKVVIHPQSVIHAITETKDNSLFCCMYKPDMRIPIRFSLFHPYRNTHNISSFDFLNYPRLDFFPLHLRNYPAFEAVMEALSYGESFLAAVNGADEAAVGLFLEGKIKFTDIAKGLEYIVKSHRKAVCRRLEDIFYWDEWGRQKVKEYLGLRRR